MYYWICDILIEHSLIENCKSFICFIYQRLWFFYSSLGKIFSRIVHYILGFIKYLINSRTLLSQLFLIRYLFLLLGILCFNRLIQIMYFFRFLDCALMNYCLIKCLIRVSLFIERFLLIGLSLFGNLKLIFSKVLDFYFVT